ncbi:MAG: plasmid stabilization protein [Betaproteobacteria bacterium]|nr:plasmid stabilization protein [Betaproteobacteria bacterium]
MIRLTIRNVDPEILSHLWLQAAAHDRLVKEQACALVRGALAGLDASASSLGEAICKRLQPRGGLDLGIAARRCAFDH